MDNYTKAILRKKINRLIKRGALQNKKIVLFGASVFSKEIKNCLLEQNFVVSEIVDNDRRKIGTKCMDLTVKRPETFLLPCNKDFVILMFSGGFYREMTSQLVQMGYEINKQVFALNFKINETLPVVAYMLARAIRGFFAYRKLIKGSFTEKTIFVAPYTGTGDIYLTGLFFKEYLSRNAISDYVFVVVSGACKKVAEMFDIKNIVVLKPTVADDIINCYLFLRVDWRIVVLNDGWMGEPIQWIRGYKGLNFEKMFRYFVFGFDDTMQLELPPKKNAAAEIDSLFLSNGLKKGKTVVLSPYSNTLFDLPDELWKKIVHHCKGLGYTVCTNCSGEKETPIEGTKAVFFPLGQAIEFMNAAGFFIGVRSGLCEIISSSTCKKIILYEKEGFFYKCTPFEYFSLRKMGLCSDVIEIEYRDDLKDTCLSEIYKMFD